MTAPELPFDTEFLPSRELVKRLIELCGINEAVTEVRRRNSRHSQWSALFQGSGQKMKTENSIPRVSIADEKQGKKKKQ